MVSFRVAADRSGVKSCSHIHQLSFSRALSSSGFISCCSFRPNDTSSAPPPHLGARHTSTAIPYRPSQNGSITHEAARVASLDPAVAFWGTPIHRLEKRFWGELVAFEVWGVRLLEGRSQRAGCMVWRACICRRIDGYRATSS